MKAITIADYIVSQYQKVSKDLTNLKLSKILYYIQGYSLKVFNKPMFEEDIVHWPYGPSVPDVFYKFHVFGPDPLEIYDKDREKRAETILTQHLDKKLLIDRIISFTYDLSYWQLIEMTRKEYPFVVTKENETIELSTLKIYFKEMDSDPLEIL